MLLAGRHGVPVHPVNLKPALKGEPIPELAARSYLNPGQPLGGIKSGVFHT